MTVRWTPSRKAAVCAQIRRGEITRERAILAHGLTAEELEHWLERDRLYGELGLRVGRTQRYRTLQGARP